jgi:hypothetical protein
MSFLNDSFIWLLLLFLVCAIPRCKCNPLSRADVLLLLLLFLVCVVLFKVLQQHKQGYL